MERGCYLYSTTIIYSVQSTQTILWSVSCKINTVQDTMHSVKHTVSSVQCTLHCVQCTVFSVQKECDQCKESGSVSMVPLTSRHLWVFIHRANWTPINCIALHTEILLHCNVISLINPDVPVLVYLLHFNKVYKNWVIDPYQAPFLNFDFHIVLPSVP